MIRIVALLALVLPAPPAGADIVVPTRTIPAHALISPEDLELRTVDVPGAVSDPAQLIGMEARVALFAGRPIRPGDIAFPAIIERNQIVSLIFARGGLVITTEGRALDRASPGDVIQVMNLTSRATVTATIGIDGAAHVAN